MTVCLPSLRGPDEISAGAILGRFGPAGTVTMLGFREGTGDGACPAASGGRATVFDVGGVIDVTTGRTAPGLRRSGR